MLKRPVEARMAVDIFQEDVLLTSENKRDFRAKKQRFNCCK